MELGRARCVVSLGKLRGRTYLCSGELHDHRISPDFASTLCLHLLASHTTPDPVPSHALQHPHSHSHSQPDTLVIAH
ncbi:hypothetical protein PAXRUDRAFT_690852 [Paxillus rubicundulus Ve08.2h10]|uniref:Uncharacterized protein n=1 Tax=Paxillus rubicundulus Ve08.2h10 TaxID=930991 RepID=A0A0D0DXH3_9AGAM|nr:hypothetical protein PAXRUDRAFT_245883 [Paxillus rubicundulus Ve08.2h10]KIK87360.1 hypothetical protein PAXRUDRAFT_690852 [Paxillus rubicundulus Ve08.2h10]